MTETQDAPVVAPVVPTATPAPQSEVKLAPAPAVVATVEEIKAEIVRVFGTRANEALCIAKNESGFRANAVGYNKDAVRSHDRGLYQLNSYWHREVSDAEAYSYKANIAHAYRISEGGTNWNQWMTKSKCI